MPNLQRFEGPSLDAVLEDVRRAAGPDATIVEANRVRAGGVAGFFARERFEVLVDAAEAAAVDGPGGAGGAAGLLAMADRVSDDEAAAGPAHVSTEGASFASVLGRLAAACGEERPAATAGTADVLARVGSPGGPVPDPAALLSMLSSLPAADPLPRARTSVVAAVGAGGRALALAAELAHELELDPDGIVLASPRTWEGDVPLERRIASPEDAAERRRSWRRRAAPGVVAVEAPEGPDAGRWVAALLDALEPTVTWVSVEASRKPEDVAAWCAAIGHVDALAVTGLDQTVTPGSVLLAGIPVGRLDGRPATPARWAGVLAPARAA